VKPNLNPHCWSEFLGITVLLLFLCGCATQYDLTLTNGDVVRAKSKPRLNEEGQFVFKDLAGHEATINRMRVREIEPVRAGSRPSSPFLSR
jgi:hypothetical protein